MYNAMGHVTLLVYVRNLTSRPRAPHACPDPFRVRDLGFVESFKGSGAETTTNLGLAHEIKAGRP